MFFPFVLFFSLFALSVSVALESHEPSTGPTFHPSISSAMPANPPQAISVKPIASQPTYAPLSVAPTLSYAMEVTAAVDGWNSLPYYAQVIIGSLIALVCCCCTIFCYCYCYTGQKKKKDKEVPMSFQSEGIRKGRRSTDPTQTYDGDVL